MKPIDLVNKYRKIIQNYIAVYRSEKNLLPSLHEIVNHLLNKYQEESRTFSSVFFGSTASEHIEFVRILSVDLNDPQFDLVGSLNTYLKTHKLEKDDAFFALWVAYFYYYNDIYPDLSDYISLIQQILMPTSLFKKRMKNDLIDILLAQVDDKNPKICLDAIRKLGLVYIPDGKQDAVIKKLLEKINSEKISVPYGNCLSVYNISSQAWDSLCKIPVSIEMRDAIQAAAVDILFNKPDKDLDEEVFASVCEVLGNLGIPEKQREAGIDKLFAKIGGSYAIGTSAGKLLVKLGIPKEKRESWIKKLLNDMDTLNDEKTILCLSMIPIPKGYTAI